MSLVGVFVGFITSNISSVITSMQVNSSASSVSVVSIHEATVSSSTSLEIIMSNEIIVFGDSSVYNRLSTVAKVYSEIWRDIDDTVNVSKEQWMSISILSDAKPKINKVYSLSSKNKKVVDKEFDRLHKKGKMI